MEVPWSEKHAAHIKGGYFEKNCLECAKFAVKYLEHGRRFK